LRPRPRTAVALTAATGVFIKPRDVARLAVAVADEVDGVRDAKASANRRTVSVRIADTVDPGDTAGTGDMADTSVRDAVESAVTQRLSALDRPMRVSVTAQGGTR